MHMPGRRQFLIATIPRAILRALLRAAAVGLSACAAQCLLAAEAMPPAPPLERPPQIIEAPTLPPLYSVHAQAGRLPEPVLRQTGQMQPLSRDSVEPRPAFVAADRISGKDDVEMVAEGNVELRKAGKSLTTDHLIYWQQEDEFEAVGKVELSSGEDRISGPKLRLKVDTSVGYFDQPRYQIKRAPPRQKPGEVLPLTTGSGHAARIDFEGEDHYRLSEATYSTCPADGPAWYARAAEMNLDYETEEGVARNATLVFHGLPILYSPWLSFSLNNARKSGMLAPTLGSTSKTGLEATLPYFWNIAPDMDATIVPRLMTKRGVQLGGEFRYLDFNYKGQLRGEYLDDQSAHRVRSSLSLQHTQNFGRGFSGSVDLNRVSDDNYFTDLSSRITSIVQNNLLRQGNLNYQTDWWRAGLMAQGYQTLQDPAVPPLIIPYRRLPQLTLYAYRPNLPGGSTLTVNGEFVDFAHPTQALGRRTTVYPQLALPLATAAAYITTKIGVNSTRYSLERQAPGTPATLIRNVPITSVDGGVFLERKLGWFGRDLTQTLEPRVYYLYVPSRDQHLVPLFDTGLADFNFAQIFSENRYSGGDRIGDANQVTTALTSRLIDPGSGAELLRGMVGQRIYFRRQEVTLPGESVTNTTLADFLAAVSGQVMPKTYLDAAWQYNPRTNLTDRLTLTARYLPELGKVINAGYRYTRDDLTPANRLRQIDVSVQWPLAGNWYGVGRYNYSLIERRIIETVGGLEYNGGCWVSRVVLQRLASASGSSSTAFFVQLELNGFSSLGSNPMDLLKRSIPGYGRINQPMADPSFAAN